MPAVDIVSPLVPRLLKPGIYCPTPTFFLPDSEDLDLPTFEKHVVAVASAGIGLVISGSMGEGHHLEPLERVQLIKSARSALDQAGLVNIPIIAGTGAGSTRETIALSKQAAEAGADYNIVILSGYFAGALIPDAAAIKTFFREVASESPIPVMIYNFPGAAGGIDLGSDIIEQMAIENPNICGVKLTCGNVGKLSRIASTVSPILGDFSKKYPRKNPESTFVVLGGFADFILPSTFVDGHGAITGLSNLAPYALTRLFELSSRALTDRAALKEAQLLQGIIAQADRTIALTGIAGTKWLLVKHKGYGGVCRKPLGPFSDSEDAKLWAHPHVVDLLRTEKLYEQQASKATKS